MKIVIDQRSHQTKSSAPKGAASSMQQGVKESKITAVEKSDQVGNVKTKDPRKVELGKKLAKISKEAKERKAKQHEALHEADREAGHEAQREEQHDDKKLVEKINEYTDLRYVGGVTIVATVGGLYYAYKNDYRIEKREQKIKNDREAYRESKLENQHENNFKASKDKKNSNNFEIKKCKPSTKTNLENL